MKSAQDFTLYVDSKFNRVSHFDGQPLPENEAKVVIKKGEDVPAELLSDILQFNRDYLDMNTATAEEWQQRKKPAPIIVPRKYSQSSLTKDIHGKTDSQAVIYLKGIMKKDFGESLEGKKPQPFINAILTAQEKAR